MINSPRLFKDIFFENLKDIFSWRALAIPIGLIISILIGHPDSSSLRVILFLITSYQAWLIYFLLFVLDAFVRAIYWYARERNPRYIKKMEAYEKMKQEKEATKSKETPQ